MLNNLKRKAVELARRRDLYLTGVTSRESLSGLLKLLRPMHTGHELIRLGGESDGGYLVPNDLDGLVACFSPGVSDIADFEVALARRGIRSYLADASVDAPPVPHPLFSFDKKFLGRSDSGDHMTLETWMNAKSASGDSILQMDIEGAEYDVLFATPSSVLRRFRIIVIEFHGLDRLASPDYFTYVYMLMEKLTLDFVCCHIHPNNWAQPVSVRGIAIPPLIEVTLLRRDRAISLGPRSDFPHPLDRPNIKGRVDVVLPRAWLS